MLVAELMAKAVLAISAVLILILMFKYIWFNRAFDLFEKRPAAYQNPAHLPWWYVGDTCRYQRRK